MTDTLPLESRLCDAWPPRHWRRGPVILAVSGGPDSMALLRAMLRVNANLPQPARLTVAHFHHGWRGAEADEDARFVRQVAHQWGLPCVEGRAVSADGETTGQGRGPEALAREQRYEFLRDAAHRAGARFVATGHTADDQAETVLHRVLRGTGPRGLRGIPRQRLLGADVQLVRPLLDCRRLEIEQYLATLGQEVRKDATNDSTRYLRNRLRHELLPELRANYNPDIDRALLRLGCLADELDAWLGGLVEQAWQDCIRVTETKQTSEIETTAKLSGFVSRGESVIVAIPPLRKMAPYLVRELLMEIWRRQAWPLRNLDQRSLREIAAFLLAAGTAPSRRQAPGGIDIQLSDDFALLQRTLRSPDIQ